MMAMKLALMMMMMAKGAPGVEWWLTVTSIAKRIIGKNTRIIAGYSLS